MQVSKFLLFGALAAAVSFSARADNAAQAAARAALMQKMNELNGGQPEQTQTPPPVVPVQTNVPPPVMTPPPAPETNSAEATTPSETNPPAPPIEVTPAGATTENPATNPSTETNSETPSAQTEMTNTAPAAEATAPAAPVVETPPAVQPTNPPSAPVIIPISPSAPAPVVIATNSADTQTMSSAPKQPGTNASGYAPIEAPPAPVTPTQQAQLQALLEQYKADQITAEQYQMQRQKILSQP